MANSALHFIGIGGIGMSALARIALARGVTVTGSNDVASDTTRRLEIEGARVAIGHRAEHITGTPQVIVTSAVAQDNPELLAARTAGLTVLGRGELLAHFFNAMRGIAIAGTHGKTTVTGMLATILEAANIDPTVAVGGLRRESGTNFRCGQSPWFLTESDESDGSFLSLRPEIAVVLNLENDHITSDEGMATLREQFATFLRGVPSHGMVILGADDPECARLQACAQEVPIKTFGFSPDAWLQAIDMQADGVGSRSIIVENGQRLGELRLAVPGAMNLANALAAIAVARTLDISFHTIAQALASFEGVRRRFDILHRSSRMIVVDDYAHHPTAVAATIAAARAAHPGPVLVAFQAHRYSRTAYLAADFARSLEGADEVFLPEIYAASEVPVVGVDEKLIGTPLAACGYKVSYTPRHQLVQTILAQAPPGAMVLMLGAGDITQAAHELVAALDVADRSLIAHAG